MDSISGQISMQAPMSAVNVHKVYCVWCTWAPLIIMRLILDFP